MIPTEPKPYSRWRLTDTLDQLAETYDAAASAVDAFSRSAFFYDPMAPRPTIRARARASLHAWGARRGWPRTAWFAVTSILAIGFMAWISMRILGKLAPGTPPAVVAMVPGLLLALALVGTSVLTASALASYVTRPGQQARWPAPAWPHALFAVCLTGCAAWVAVWLISTARVHVWAATLIGVLSTTLTGAVLLMAGRPAMPARTGGLPSVRQPAPAPRQLLAQQRRAQALLRGHTRKWSVAAHQCGAAVKGSTEAEATLLQLLAEDDGDQPSPDVEVFHAQLIGTLARYRPDLLRRRLNEASRSLLPQAARS